MKPKKRRSLIRQLFTAAELNEPTSGNSALPVTALVANENHGIDSRDVLRTLGATHLGPATVDRGDGISKPVEGHLWARGNKRYLRVSKRVVLDITQCKPEGLSPVVVLP